MATISLGGHDYPAFTTRADATIYLAGDVSRAAGWALLADEAKDRAIISAARMLLALPACEGVVLDPQAVPANEVLAEVNAMLAADLAAKPKLFSDASGGSNIKSVKAGSAQVEFFSPVAGGPPIPLALWNRLLAANLVCLGTTTGEAVSDGAYVSGTMSGEEYRALGGRHPWDWPIAALDYD